MFKRTVCLKSGGYVNNSIIPVSYRFGAIVQVVGLIELKKGHLMLGICYNLRIIT